MNDNESKNPVIRQLNAISPLSGETMQKMQDLIRFEKQPKGTLLIPIGQIPRQLFFIEKGLARVFYLKDGMDVTDYFAIDMQFIGAMEGLFFSTPTHKGIELLEESEFYRINFIAMEQLCNSCPDLERAFRKMAQFAMVEEQNRIESIRFQSVKERYFELEKKYKGISNRAPLKHIASYLNTSNVSISRIRAGKQ